MIWPKAGIGFGCMHRPLKWPRRHRCRGGSSRREYIQAIGVGHTICPEGLFPTVGERVKRTQSNLHQVDSDRAVAGVEGP